MVDRKTPLTNEKVYHVYTRSISEFKVFRSEDDFNRMRELISFYSAEKLPCKFSSFVELSKKVKEEKISQIKCSGKIVKVLSYCIMPTHIHLVLQQMKENAISRYMNLVLMSYSKYFNIKYNRKGPLWEGRFRNVLVNDDSQLLHLTRYVHLNPVSSYLVNKPIDWKHSSYWEYISEPVESDDRRICDYSGLIEINNESYRDFVESHKDYQRELQDIKHLIFK